MLNSLNGTTVDVRKWVRSLYDNGVDAGQQPLTRHFDRVAAEAIILLTEANVLSPADRHEAAQVRWTNVTAQVGLLHDTLEDDVTDVDEIGRRTSASVALRVHHLTRRTWSMESYESYIKRLVATDDPVTLAVKLADNRDNSDISRLDKLPKERANKLSVRYREAHNLLEPAFLSATERVRNRLFLFS